MTISPMCTTENNLPKPNCDNEAQGVLIVTERQNGDMVRQQLICQPCADGEIRGWKMQPDGYYWTVTYLSFQGLVEVEKTTHLIEAEPKMLSALEQLMIVHQDMDKECTCAPCRAIAKAKGA